MKKKILLFTLVGVGSYLMLTSYQSGPAYNGYDCTGAHNTGTTCGVYGCHGTGTGPAVSITVYSGTTPVTSYAGGQSYKIHIHGSGTSMTWWGFQLACATGTGSAQINAGSWGTLPGGTHSSTLGGIKIVEHSMPFMSSTTGSFDSSFAWIAPAAGKGTVSIYCTINAINNDGFADAGDVSGNTHIQLTEVPTAVSNVLDNAGIKTYPNPVRNELKLEIDNASAGDYALKVYNMAGSAIFTEQQNISSDTYSRTINTGNWAPGVYILQIGKDGSQRALQIVKQ